jgi:spermidine synthase
MTDSGNRRLYGREGLQACRRALRNQGCLAVWSAEPNKKFEQRLMSCSFHVRRYRVSAYRGSKSPSRFVWVAAEDKAILPTGGGEPRLPPKKNPPRGGRRRYRKRRF